MRSNPYRFRHGRRVLYAPEFVEAQGDCQCHKSQGAGLQGELTEKIKRNPIVFVVGALLAGWFLAKKH